MCKVFTCKFHYTVCHITVYGNITTEMLTQISCLFAKVQKNCSLCEIYVFCLAILNIIFYDEILKGVLNILISRRYEYRDWGWAIEEKVSAIYTVCLSMTIRSYFDRLHPATFAVNRKSIKLLSQTVSFVSLTLSLHQIWNPNHLSRQNKGIRYT